MFKKLSVLIIVVSVFLIAQPTSALPAGEWYLADTIYVGADIPITFGSALSPDGQYLYLNSRDAYVGLYDVDNLSSGPMVLLNRGNGLTPVCGGDSFGEALLTQDGERLILIDEHGAFFYINADPSNFGVEHVFHGGSCSYEYAFRMALTDNPRIGVTAGVTGGYPGYVRFYDIQGYPTGPETSINMGSDVHFIESEPGANRAYAFTFQGRLHVIDTANRLVTGTINTNVNELRDMVFDTDNNIGYLSSYDGISLLNTQTQEFEETWDVGLISFMVYRPEMDFIAATRLTSVAFIDTNTGTVLQDISLPGSFRLGYPSMAPDGKTLYVPDVHGNLYVLKWRSLTTVLDANMSIHNDIYGTGDGSSPDTNFGFTLFVRAQGDFSSFDKSNVSLTVDNVQLDLESADVSYDGEKYHIEARGNYRGVPLLGEYKATVTDANGQISNTFTIGTLEDYPKDAPEIRSPGHLSAITEFQPTFSWEPFDSMYLGQPIAPWSYEVNIYEVNGEFFYVWPIEPDQTSLNYVNPEWIPYQPPDLVPGEYNFALHSNHFVAPRFNFEHHRTFTFRVNQPPVADAGGPYMGAINAPITFDGSGSSDLDNDTLIFNWDFGDESNDTGVAPNHTYSATGIYTVCLTVNDSSVDSAPNCTLAVVYDPDGGFVTGGGWIWSPEGAYTPDPILTGKATFGFVSKYKKGANVPTGNTEFQFKVADLNFKSTSYDWLVITGKKAMYKGTGTINGMGEYGFMLSAIDGTPDKFRIKIWDKAAETVVYDNQLGDVEDAEPATELGGGSIVVHKK